jgi:Hemerythrin HHE cation binding domain
VPAHVWQRFTSLLVAHFEAEEEVCYRPMSEVTRGAAGRRREAIADHDDIREAIRAASQLRPGSAPWWRTVTDTLTASTGHLDREERGILATRLPRLTLSERRRLGHQWLVLTTPSARHPAHET